MKKLFALLLLLSTGYGLPAQTRADLTLAETLNTEDLFTLRERYPALKDSVSIDMLDLLARAVLAVGFNRPAEAAPLLDTLLLFHQEELGPDSSLGMAAVRALNLLNLGLYAQAGAAGESLVQATEGRLPFESTFSFLFVERVGKGLANHPVPRLDRPDGEVCVPMRTVAAGKGYHLHIPVEVNGVCEDFIFDTGCSFGNFVSERYAERVGLRIVADSVPVAGTAVGFVKLATADSLRVGEIVYRHPYFLVAPPDPSMDSLFAFHGVLGCNFISAVGEVVLDMESSCFRFPARPGDGEPNMTLSANIPTLRIEYDGVPWGIVFDTGNVRSDLGMRFALRFPAVAEGLEERIVQRGGFGGLVSARAVTLPRFDFTVAGVPATLYDVDLYRDAEAPEGSLGSDFVLTFRRLTINYEKMFVRPEP